MKNILRVENLFAKYNSMILKNISFDISEGEVVCLIGANGSGKSTLLSSLVKLEIPNFEYSSNSVFVNNCLIDNMNRREISKNISLMIQNESCIWNFSVRDFITLGKYFYKENFDKEVEYVSDLLDVKNLLDKNINCISGGEFQKVRIARSIFQDAKVMLLDEPTSALDINYQFNLLSKIKKVVKEKNICAIISIHDINLASIFADRIFLLKKINSISENENQLVIGNPNEILNSNELSFAFKTNFGTFIHPEYNKTQIYVKGY